MNSHCSDRRRANRVFLLAVLGLLIAAMRAGAQTIEYSRERGNIVVKFTEILGEMKDADRGPSVRFYGDSGIFERRSYLVLKSPKPRICVASHFH